MNNTTEKRIEHLAARWFGGDHISREETYELVRLLHDERKIIHRWRDIDTAPKEGMFLVAKPKGHGWSVTLAYRTVSGGICSEPASRDLSDYTLWHPMPDQPRA